MCGITGIFSNIARKDLEASVLKMSQTLTHRGPDDSGVWVDKNNNITLAHQRLSILDLSSAGHQPMKSPCGRFIVAFNGEIYNHLELREKLDILDNKNTWNGSSDTETLVAAFSFWGIEKTLDKLSGMFAISVWDSKVKRLYLIRDRFGEKPLYYGWSNGVFMFGSELKALRSYKGFDNEIDRNALSLYMQYMYVPSPYSIFKDIYKLDPGCILQIDSIGTVDSPKKITSSEFNAKGVSIKKWYSLSEVAKKSQKNLITNQQDSINFLESTLYKTVENQLISDVPLGAFLSGGVDSSMIVALMSKISNNPVKTFTIGFNERGYDEAVYAKKVSKHLKTDHHELYVSPKDAYEVIPNLPNLYDEPFADSSQIPTYLVSKLAREHVTVSLSGDSGDELFGGYNRYLWGKDVWNKLKWMPSEMRSFLGKGIQKVPLSIWNNLGDSLPKKYEIEFMGSKVHRLANRLKTVNNLNDMYYSLVSEDYQGDNIVLGTGASLSTKLTSDRIIAKFPDSEHRMMLWDAITYLPDDILTKVDRAAMGVGLETRIPFLDHKVVELAWRMPLEMKIKNKVGKWPLRQVLYKHVPKELIERPKAGFAIPVGRWIRGPLREWADELLDAARIHREGYFNPEMVQQLWQQHLSEKYDWTPRLWAILMFQSWLENI